MAYRDAHELWINLQDKYDVSNIIEDDCTPSTSRRDELSTYSTSPICGKTQSNEMVSSDRFCNDGSELIIDDYLPLDHCNDLSLDLNTSSTIHALHDRVDSPCISYGNCLPKSHDDMLALSCCHDTNTCVSSSSIFSNNVEIGRAHV